MYVARSVHRQAVEPLVAGKAADQTPAMRRKIGMARCGARALQVEGPEPPALRLRDIDRSAVRRQADAIRHDQGIGDLDDARAVGQRIIEPAIHPVAWVELAKIGEIEAAMPVEDDVVRPDEAVLAAMRVEDLALAGLQVETLDPAAGIALRHARLDTIEAARGLKQEAAIVADVEAEVGSDGKAVRSAVELRDDRNRAVGRHAGDGLPLDLHQQHRAVGTCNGPFGKLAAPRRGSCGLPIWKSCLLVSVVSPAFSLIRRWLNRRPGQKAARAPRRPAGAARASRGRRRRAYPPGADHGRRPMRTEAPR